MVLSGKLEDKVVVAVSAEKFHQIISRKPRRIAVKIPAKVKKVDLCEDGGGKVGGVIVWSYEYDGVAKIAKAVIEAIDDKKLSTTFKVIEGEIMTKYKKFLITVAATHEEENGCEVHWTFEYEKLHENIPNPDSLLKFCADCSMDLAEEEITF